MNITKDLHNSKVHFPARLNHQLIDLIWSKIRESTPEKAFRDCSFLCLIVVVSALPYLSGLGFYGSDWLWLGHLTMSEDQSLIGLFNKIYNKWTITQPGKILMLSFLYWIFGLSPLGYHLFNLLLFILNIGFFYVLLRRLNQRRILCLSAVLLYAFLPHYSSARFWFQGVILNVSLLLYLLSLFSDFQTIRAQTSRFWKWKITSVAAIIFSTLTHSITIPLFLLSPLFVWYRERQIRIAATYGPVGKRALSLRKFLRESKFRILTSVNYVAVLSVVIFKMLSTILMGHSSVGGIMKDITRICMRLFHPGYGNYDWGINYIHAFVVNYLEYGIGQLLIVWDIIRRHPTITGFLMGGAVGLAIFLYLSREMKQVGGDLPEQDRMSKFTRRGLMLFALAYGSFFTYWGIQFSTTGTANLIAIVPALGVALTIVGSLGYLSNLFKSDRLQETAFCLFITIFCTSGFLINHTIASSWTSANSQQQKILTGIQKALPTLPSNSTLILDGFCNYVGPAPLFESQWDVTGALLTMYRDYSIRGDLGKPGLRVEQDSLSVLHEHRYNKYSYQNLYVYNVARGESFRLSNEVRARQYVETFKSEHNANCPETRRGFGEPIFTFLDYVFR